MISPSGHPNYLEWRRSKGFAYFVGSSRPTFKLLMPVLQARHEEFALENQFFGQVRIKPQKQLLLKLNLAAPFFGVNRL